jgi:hypothetical protein
MLADYDFGARRWIEEVVLRRRYRTTASADWSCP